MLVGIVGFEPTHFRSQAGRATKLRHTPLNKTQCYTVCYHYTMSPYGEDNWNQTNTTGPDNASKKSLYESLKWQYQGELNSYLTGDNRV